MEQFSLEKSTRILPYRSILQEKLSFYHLGSLKRSVENNQNINFSEATRSYILNSFWQKNENFQYRGTFSNNILVIGQTGCGKTSFVQSLGKNKKFGDRLVSFDWVSKINSTKNKEDEIRECFSYRKVEFHYPGNLPDFNLLVETFQIDTLEDYSQKAKENNDDNNCNISGGKKIRQAYCYGRGLRFGTQIK